MPSAVGASAKRTRARNHEVQIPIRLEGPQFRGGLQQHGFGAAQLVGDAEECDAHQAGSRVPGAAATTCGQAPTRRVRSIRLAADRRAADVRCAAPAVGVGRVCDGPRRDSPRRGALARTRPRTRRARPAARDGTRAHVSVPRSRQAVSHAGKHSGFAALDVDLDEPHAADTRGVERRIEAARRALEIGVARVSQQPANCPSCRRRSRKAANDRRPSPAAIAMRCASIQVIPLAAMLVTSMRYRRGSGSNAITRPAGPTQCAAASEK